MIAARQIFLGRGGAKTLPYTPVYAIKSDGVAYCALPQSINASSGRVEILVDKLQSSYTEQMHIFGSHGTGDGGSFFLCHLHRSADSGFYCFGQYLSRPFDHEIIISNNDLGVGVWLDGVQCPSTQTWTASYNPKLFLIFRAGAVNASGTQPQADESVSIIAIRSMKVWFGDTQVADLIPCQDNETGEYCFYNSIDGLFVRNIAGGELQPYLGA